MKMTRSILFCVAITTHLQQGLGAPCGTLQSDLFGPQQLISAEAEEGVSAHPIDLDNDGDLDVLTQSSEGSAWHENLGAGSFGAQQPVIVEGMTVSFVADLDGDGDGDVISNQGREISWFENLGGGAFGMEQVINDLGDLGDVGSTVSVNASDLDGDGDADLLYCYTIWGLPKTALRENLGGGVFGPEQLMNTLEGGGYQVRSFDFDGDGDEELIWAEIISGHIVKRTNLGDMNFGPQSQIWPVWWSQSHAFYRDVLATDLDGDGDKDLLALSLSGGGVSVDWLVNLEDLGGYYHPEAQPLYSSTSFLGLHVCDLDGDGDAELLTASDGMLGWYENLGAGAFGEQQVLTPSGASGFHVADMDDDGELDVLATAGGVVSWYENLWFLDCNANGLPDANEITANPSLDCNGNGVPDDCDIAAGLSLDQDGNGILDECLPLPLASNPVQISVASGGQHDLTLTAPQEYGGSLYFVLGSSSGTVPGITLDGVLVPLQIFDPYFLYGVSSPNVSPFINTLGSLSATGTASAAIAVPSGLTDLAGVTIHHAYVLFGNSLEVVYASNAAPLELVP